MTKIRKTLLSVLMFVLALCLGVMFTACTQSSYTVTFNTEGKTQTVDVTEGKVSSMPADPTKDYYTFMGWYTEDGTEFTKDTEVSGDLTVYANFAAIKVNIAVNGGTDENIKLEDLAAKTTEYTEDASSQNLTFDGWYVDPAYGTKYTTQSDSNLTGLYARYMATITFNNGYEDLITEMVTPNGNVTAPDTTSSDFVKAYMDDEDISYQNSKGEAIDITNYTVTTNEVITVLWKSPDLQYELISGNEYAVTGISTDSVDYAVYSILSQNVTVDDRGTKGNVVAFNDKWSFGYCRKATKFIFNEGIEYINDFNFSSGNALKSVQLPSTLKVLESSFWNTDKLTSLDLPEGLEVVIDCFWNNYIEGGIGVYRGEGLDIAISIPESVTNLTRVPKGLDLTKNSNFTYEDGNLYNVQNGGKILCTAYQVEVSEDGYYMVKEGVTGVQVGVFDDVSFDYLSLPSTFAAVGYNNDASKYSSYTGTSLTPQHCRLA